MHFYFVTQHLFSLYFCSLMMPPHKNRSRSTGGLHWGSVWWEYSGIPGDVGAVGMFSWNIDFNHLLTVRTHTDTDCKSQDFYREKLSLCPWPNPAWRNNQLYTNSMKGRGREEIKCKEKKKEKNTCSMQGVAYKSDEHILKSYLMSMSVGLGTLETK